MDWTFRLHDLEFTVRESTRRKTVSLGIERDGQLLIRVPQGTDQEQLTEFIKEKLDWVYGKLAQKEEFYRPGVQRQFVNGEGFLYAGRSYRLLLSEDVFDDEPLRLNGQRFVLSASHAVNGREVFIEWYSMQLRQWAQGQLMHFTSRLKALPTALQVEDLGYHWGTASQSGLIKLHWRVALLPPRIAEYVLLHELVHLEFHHHRPAFWTRLEALLPDYLERKAWLAKYGADYDL